LELDRREFAKNSIISAGVISLTGLAAVSPSQASAAAPDFNLAAEAISKTMVDGTILTVWQFRDLGGFGPGRLGSGLSVREGDPVTVTLYNDLDREVSIEIPGVLTDTPRVAPGASHSYDFTAPGAGSYLFCDGVNGDIGRAMGLAGPMIVMPRNADTRLTKDGPSFDRQYTLVLQELDDRVNRRVASGGESDMSGFEPNYFFVNGLSYPHTTADADTLISMNVGDSVALRIINAGLITNPMHFHGYHVEVVSRDRLPETAVVEKDTVPVGVDECVDVILTCNQPGAYPLHTHYVPGVTANGVYLNPYGGALIVMNAV
jgi:FtsP/CotA-like multicopper oxidase with cupredoxin domain